MNFKRIWLTAAIVSLISLPFVLTFEDKHPYVVAVPIILGAGIIIFLEIRDDIRKIRRP